MFLISANRRFHSFIHSSCRTVVSSVKTCLIQVEMLLLYCGLHPNDLFDRANVNRFDVDVGANDHDIVEQEQEQPPRSL